MSVPGGSQPRLHTRILWRLFYKCPRPLLHWDSDSPAWDPAIYFLKFPKWWNIINIVCLVVQMARNLPAMQETWVPSLDQEDTLEKGMATHSSILAWRIPWTEQPGGLHPWVRRVRHDWVTNTHTHKWLKMSSQGWELTPSGKESKRPIKRIFWLRKTFQHTSDLTTLASFSVKWVLSVYHISFSCSSSHFFLSFFMRNVFSSQL